MSFQEKSIVCFDCGATFNFTVEEQEFFATKGYTNEPKRCPSCVRQENRTRVILSTATAATPRLHHGRCIPWSAPSAARIPKYPFRPQAADRFTAVTATTKSL